MKLVIAVLSGALLLLGAGPSQAQDASGTIPPAGTTAAQPEEPRDKPGADVEAPKVDPKLLIDMFNLLTRPRRPPAQPAAPPPAPPLAPPRVEPAPTVAVTPLQVPPPAAAPAPPRALPTTVATAPRDVRPNLSPAPKPPRRTIPPTPPAAPAELAAVPTPPELPVAAPTESATRPSPPASVVQPVAPPSPIVLPAQRSSSLLAKGNWLLLALLAAAAIAAAATWKRMRQIARTRAALSLEPRLDLAEGSASVGSLALACPPMSIRTRLEMAGG